MSWLTHRTGQEIGRLVRARELSPVEVVEETLRRIEEVNPRLNAFVLVDADGALREARRLEEALSAGEAVGPLAGVPVGVKDLEDAAGLVTSFGSLLYRTNEARADSVQVARLRAAGAIILGKTNTPEFGYTVFTKNRLFGVTRNPWNLERTPGGSSGGSAAAVAAGLVPLATGTDAGGSVRIPAAYCGCFGLKPSLGRIPAGAFPGPHPLLAMHPISVAGPLTRTVADAALFLDCVAGYHPSDPSSLPAPAATYGSILEQRPACLRIAYSPTLGGRRVQREVADRVERAVRVFEELGHRVELWEAGLPDASAAWSGLLNCDFFAQARQALEESPGELSRSLAVILEETRPFGLPDLLDAQRERTELNRALWELFDRYDLLLTPTAPTEAFDAAGPLPDAIDGYPVSLFDFLCFAYPFNFSGHPAASVPAGCTAAGLPTGLQIVGGRHRDDLVLRAARAYEEACPWSGPGLLSV
ncbi:MAG: amidase [Deltaproteobacteria bacterium]|nr:amidase [Deltaproteobacteria bacterium]